MSERRWNIVISSKPSLFNLDLKEVWEYRDLLLLFVKRDFTATYKQTILGPLWFFIQPILTALILSVIFGRVANLPTDGTPRMLFYLSGLVGWNFFSECILKTSNVFTANQMIFGKVYFPRLVVPLSIVISSLFRLLIQLLVFGAFWIYYFFDGASIVPGPEFFFLPIFVLLLMVLGLSLGLICSALTTKYRDLSFLLAFGVQLLMYASPVIYPSSMLPASLESLLFFNPLSHIIEAIRFGLLGKGALDWFGIFYSFCFLSLTSLVGLISFSYIEKNFMDSV